MRFFATAIVFLCACFDASAHAEEVMIEKQKPFNEGCTVSDDETLGGILISQRGCCSWHNGVCGCSSGRVLCCDGTLSPSCRCERDDILEKSS